MEYQQLIQIDNDYCVYRGIVRMRITNHGVVEILNSKRKWVKVDVEITKIPHIKLAAESRDDRI